MTLKGDDSKERLDIAEIEVSVRRGESRVRELIDAMSILPRVDPDGSLECPFAEELYAKMEEKREIVQGLLEYLQGVQTAVSEAIQWCEKNQAVVGAGRERLHGERAKDQYSDADSAVAAEHKRLCMLRDRIRQVMEVAHKALSMAAAKQFPGRKPRGPVVGPVGGGTLPRVPVVRNPTTPGADQEVEDLFEIDRDGRAAFPDPHHPTLNTGERGHR